MTLRALLIFTLVCYLSHSEKVEGRSFRKLSLKDDEELDRSNKTLKTIKTQFGDVYDCIDFYKQPAFDHPLLKNHRFHHQMRPISFPMSIKGRENADESLHIVGLPDGGCPLGTVPIRRTTKDDWIKARLLRDESGVKHRVVVRTKSNPVRKFNGGRTWTSIYNPTVSDQQYSSGVMTLRNGDDSIEVGWTVNPGLYGDHKTRLYIDLVSPNSSCYNTECSGFVITNPKLPLGAILEPVSKKRGPVYSLNLFIYREESTGNWWVAVAKDYTPIGYWPKNIFNGLQNLATSVEWGGLTYGPPDQPIPEMGSGQFSFDDPTIDAYCAKIKTVNEANEIVDAKDTKAISNEKKYIVVDMGMQEGYEHLVVFG